MWRTYLMIAPRLRARSRVYAAINIGGLALGLAAQEAAAHARQAVRGFHIVIDRNSTKLPRFTTPPAAPGQIVKVGIDGADMVPSSIVGVVEDSGIRAARDPREPILHAYDPIGRAGQAVVRHVTARSSEVIQRINAVWPRFEPEIPFDACFAEEVSAELYAVDRARGALFALFSGFAVLIAWLAMREWLNGFDLRIDLGPGPFAFTGLLALAIALGTVASQSLRVARTNPIHALRYE